MLSTDSCYKEELCSRLGTTILVLHLKENLTRIRVLRRSEGRFTWRAYSKVGSSLKTPPIPWCGDVSTTPCPPPNIAKQYLLLETIYKYCTNNPCLTVFGSPDSNCGDEKTVVNLQTLSLIVMVCEVREVEVDIYGMFGTPKPTPKQRTLNERSKYSFRWEEIYSVFDKDYIYLIPARPNCDNWKLFVCENI